MMFYESPLTETGPAVEHGPLGQNRPQVMKWNQNMSHFRPSRSQNTRGLISRAGAVRALRG